MNQKWHLVCSGKIKIFCRAFLDGHPVKILKLSYQDMNQKCKTDQTNHIHFLQVLTLICTQKYSQKCNQLLNFPVHIKNCVWFISGWILTHIDWAYRWKKIVLLSTTRKSCPNVACALVSSERSSFVSVLQINIIQLWVRGNAKHKCRYDIVCQEFSVELFQSMTSSDMQKGK